MTYDPFDASQVQHAWPELARLRQRGGVAPLDGGMVYVTRHEGCRDVMRDTVSFSNASGFKAPGVVVAPEERTLGELDPPQHTAVRRVMVTALSPKVVHRAEPVIEQMARDLVEQLPSGAVDLVAGFTVPLPNQVTVSLLGFPAADAEQIARWAKELMVSGFPATNRSDRGEGFAAAFPEFAGYIDDRIDARSAELAAGVDDHPTEVLTRLLRFEGGALSKTQVRALVRNLITGGLTTTSQLLGNLIHDVVTDPSIEAAARGPQLDTVVEESLRLQPPVMFAVRGCVEDVEIEGCPIRAGQRVIVGNGSANRDERVFDAPDAFRVDRSNADQHLTFGFGPHVCPGAALARAVARIGIRCLLDRFAPGRMGAAAGYRYENVPTFFEFGPRELLIDLSEASTGSP